MNFLFRFHRFFYSSKPSEDPALKVTDSSTAMFREWGFHNEKVCGKPRVLMAAGHGYGNVGDEAQCGACVDRWRRVAPDCRITLFTPSPAYTYAVHGEFVEWAPRVAWFSANWGGTYFKQHYRFAWDFFWLRWRLSLSCRLMRANFPLSFLRVREARILDLIQQHDIIHISGGGFLTGKTRSRLWENCLLLHCCNLLNKPYFLTGHNIGVFNGWMDRRIARMGLSKAKLIGLRDRGISEAELAGINISGEHVKSTCDDALLCPRATKDQVIAELESVELDVSKPWVAAQFHEWGQAKEEREKIAHRYAELCDAVYGELGLQVVLISMTPSDVEPEKRIESLTSSKIYRVPYSPDFRIVRGIIADSVFCLTMKHHPIVFAQGEGVPIVSIALDDYYIHKNKGALANTGHEDFLVSGVEFYGNKVIELMKRCIKDKDCISREMLDWVEKMKLIELADYETMRTKIPAGC